MRGTGSVIGLVCDYLTKTVSCFKLPLSVNPLGQGGRGSIRKDSFIGHIVVPKKLVDARVERRA